MSSTQPNQRNKPSLVGAGLSDEARRAMNAAFDALSEWRNEMSSVAERNTATVFDKMGAAAKAMGWPADFVDMTRKQMQQASRMQLQMIDQVMDIWEQQMKAPGAPFKALDVGKGSPLGPFGAMGGAMPFLPGLPGFDMSNMPTNPMQFWMQAAELWQKSWQQAFQSWMDMQQHTFERGKNGR